MIQLVNKNSTRRHNCQRTSETVLAVRLNILRPVASCWNAIFSCRAQGMLCGNDEGRARQRLAGVHAEAGLRRERLPAVVQQVEHVYEQVRHADALEPESGYECGCCCLDGLGDFKDNQSPYAIAKRMEKISSFFCLEKIFFGLVVWKK